MRNWAPLWCLIGVCTWYKCTKQVGKLWGNTFGWSCEDGAVKNSSLPLCPTSPHRLAHGVDLWDFGKRQCLIVDILSAGVRRAWYLVSSLKPGVLVGKSRWSVVFWTARHLISVHPVLGLLSRSGMCFFSAGLSSLDPVLPTYHLLFIPGGNPKAFPGPDWKYNPPQWVVGMPLDPFTSEAPPFFNWSIT